MTDLNNETTEQPNQGNNNEDMDILEQAGEKLTTSVADATTISTSHVDTVSGFDRKKLADAINDGRTIVIGDQLPLPKGGVNGMFVSQGLVRYVNVAAFGGEQANRRQIRLDVVQGAVMTRLTSARLSKKLGEPQVTTEICTAPGHHSRLTAFQDNRWGLLEAFRGFKTGEYVRLDAAGTSMGQRNDRRGGTQTGDFQGINVSELAVYTKDGKMIKLIENPNMIAQSSQSSISGGTSGLGGGPAIRLT